MFSLFVSDFRFNLSNRSEFKTRFKKHFPHTNITRLSSAYTEHLINEDYKYTDVKRNQETLRTLNKCKTIDLLEKSIKFTNTLKQNRKVYQMINLTLHSTACMLLWPLEIITLNQDPTSLTQT